MRTKNPADHYLASLRQLEARIDAWEALPAAQVGAALDDIRREVVTRGEIRKGSGTLTFSLACVDGLEAPDSESKALRRSLHNRLTMLQAKGRQENHDASVRAEVARGGGKTKQEKNPEAIAIAAAKAKAYELWKDRELTPGGKGIGTQERFAMEIIGKWPELTSVGTIVKWIRAWRAEAAAVRRKFTGESP